MDARLILDAASSGPWNMAVDEVLFRELAPGRPGVLRLYRWSEPTLSIGYFQSWLERKQHATSRALRLVRRASGGGAIVHDRELTYSLALRVSEDGPAAARQLMAAVHQSLVDYLGELGIEARKYGVQRERPTGEPFLCFQRRSADDLVIGPHKVVGSAQRRQRGAILQHGSILLRRSPAAPELAGLEDLVTAAVGFEEHLTADWPERLAQALGLRLCSSQLRADESAAVEQMVREKFAAPRWNEKR